MNEREEVAIRSVINVLQRLLPSGGSIPPLINCPVHRFAHEHLVADTGSSLTTASIASLYAELTGAGKVPPLSRRVLERRLAGAIQTTVGIRKTHSVIDAGRQRRGYKGLGFAPDPK